jgi:hypothetical protein
MNRPHFIVITLAYWLAGLTLGGLVVTFNGDCGIAPDRTACFAESRAISFLMLALCSLGYAVLIWRLRRKKEEKTGPTD